MKILLIATLGFLVLRAAPPTLEEATALYASGRYAEANAAFEQLRSDTPEAEPVLYHLGKLAVHRGDYPRAVDLLERATALAPDDAGAVLWLGNAHAWSASVAEKFTTRIGHGRRALSLYRRAVELDPANLPARFALMNFCRHVPAVFGGGIDRAYVQVREIASRDADAGTYAQALLLFHEQKHDAAYATLTRLRLRQPNHYGASFLLGRLAAASGKHLDEARAALRLCLRLTPGENDDSHDAAALLLASLDAPAPPPAAVTVENH